MKNPKRIEDIEQPLLADLRNKLGPIKNILAILSGAECITHPLILKELEHSKEVIKFICQQEKDTIHFNDDRPDHFITWHFTALRKYVEAGLITKDQFAAIDRNYNEEVMSKFNSTDGSNNKRTPEGNS